MTTSLTLVRPHGYRVARAQKNTVGPLGMFPPKAMQYPRCDPSPRTLLLAVASGGSRKATSPGDPHLSPSGDSTLGLFQQSSQGWELGTENSQQPGRAAQPGRWQHTGAAPADGGDTGTGSVGARPPLPGVMPHREPPRPDAAATTATLHPRSRCRGAPAGPAALSRAPHSQKTLTCVRTDGWGRAGSGRAG